MRAIVKRRWIDFIINYSGLTFILIYADWWIFVIAIFLSGWNFYDGYTRLAQYDRT